MDFNKTTLTKPLLVVDRVTKSYGRIKALDSVSLSISGGEFTALLGANGAGKSSTFAAMHFVFFGAPVPTNEDTSATSKQAVLEIHDLVNTKRISQDSGVTSVTAIFTHESVTYEMTRKINFKKIDVTKC